MTLDELANIDLRLLVIFNAIMEERSVSRAAARLGGSQSGMSRTLQKLRKMFKDPLFIRHSHGLSPTLRAEQLDQQIRPLLDNLLQVMSPAKLDLASLDRTFKISAPDFFSQALIVPLLNALKNYPGIRLEIRDHQDQSMNELVSGKVDFVFGVQENVPADVHAKILGYDTGVCLISKNHSFIKDEISMEQLRKLQFVDLLLPGVDQLETFDYWLITQGLDQPPIIETESIMTALNAVQSSDLAMIFGARLSRYLASNHGLQGLKTLDLPIPKSVMPPIYIKYFWHRRYHHDLAHQWMRQLITDVVAATEILE